MDKYRDKFTKAIINLGWKNGQLTELAEAFSEGEDLNPYLDDGFIKDYVKGKYEL